MATRKPISTISYNTEAFLLEKLEDWRAQHIIQSYMYIHHKGEDGDKDHFHVRIEPNRTLDPMELQALLREYTPENDKPLGVRPFRPSKEEDWILYVVHDEDYLRYKYGGGDSHEKLPYQWQDIKADDDFDVEIAYIRARSALEHNSASIAKKIVSGVSPLNLFLAGEDVIKVNAISRGLQENDYIRLAREYNDLSNRWDSLLKLLDDYGICVVVDDDGLSLSSSCVPE